MEQFQRYELRKSNSQPAEFTLILYLHDHLTEFADELGSVQSDRKDILTTARRILNERYPNVKVTMVKVILGGMVINSVPFGTKLSTVQAAEPTISQVENPSKAYYRVASGDTLWIVSRKFNTSVDFIKKANYLISDVLQLNQLLIIPKAFHKVTTGDYLAVLAKKYGTTVDAIKEVNNLTSDTTRLGQTLIIPFLIDGTELY
jgi:peptidoglycan endopeptidase LytF